MTEELAIKAMRSGARDWVLKGNLARLLPAIDRELEDAAQRRRAEAALRRSEEMLRQSQKLDAIGGLAAGVAHDFNNVLSVIIGHADLLLADLAPTDRNRESVDEIHSAAGGAAELTRQLLAFSRQQILQPQKVSIARIVTGTAKMLRRLIGEDIELVIDASTTTGSSLVDPGQIEQVIVNLVVNARDAMPNGGRLTIGVANVEVGADEDGAVATPGSYVALRVADTGVGMDAETQSDLRAVLHDEGARQGHGSGSSRLCSASSNKAAAQFRSPASRHRARRSRSSCPASPETPSARPRPARLAARR